MYKDDIDKAIVSSLEKRLENANDAGTRPEIALLQD